MNLSDKSRDCRWNLPFHCALNMAGLIGKIAPTAHCSYWRVPTALGEW